MRVDLAAQVVVIISEVLKLSINYVSQCLYFVQVLSESVSNALTLTGGSTVEETAVCEVDGQVLRLHECAQFRPWRSSMQTLPNALQKREGPETTGL